MTTPTVARPLWRWLLLCTLLCACLGWVHHALGAAGAAQGGGPTSVLEGVSLKRNEQGQLGVYLNSSQHAPHVQATQHQGVLRLTLPNTTLGEGLKSQGLPMVMDEQGEFIARWVQLAPNKVQLVIPNTGKTKLGYHIAGPQGQVLAQHSIPTAAPASPTRTAHGASTVPNKKAPNKMRAWFRKPQALAATWGSSYPRKPRLYTAHHALKPHQPAGKLAIAKAPNVPKPHHPMVAVAKAKAKAPPPSAVAAVAMATGEEFSSAPAPLRLAPASPDTADSVFERPRPDELRLGALAPQTPPPAPVGFSKRALLWALTQVVGALLGLGVLLLLMLPPARQWLKQQLGQWLGLQHPLHPSLSPAPSSPLAEPALSLHPLLPNEDEPQDTTSTQTALASPTATVGDERPSIALPPPPLVLPAALQQVVLYSHCSQPLRPLTQAALPQPVVVVPPQRLGRMF